MYAKKVTFGILKHVVAKMVNMQEVLLVIQLQYDKIKEKVLQQKLFQQKVLGKNCFNKNCFDKVLYFACFLLITMALLRAVSIYCYLMKYQAKKTFTTSLLHH